MTAVPANDAATEHLDRDVLDLRLVGVVLPDDPVDQIQLFLRDSGITVLLAFARGTVAVLALLHPVPVRWDESRLLHLVIDGLLQ